MMRRLDSIDKIVNRHLCMGCGACAAARPDAVTMIDTETHGRRPRLRKRISKPENEALARICPGREIEFEPARDYDRAAWGPILEVWEGHAVDPELRGQGIGRQLVRDSLALARSGPWAFCFVSGERDYYPKLGFSKLTAHQVDLPAPIEEERLHIISVSATNLEDLPEAPWVIRSS